MAELKQHYFSLPTDCAWTINTGWLYAGAIDGNANNDCSPVGMNSSRQEINNNGNDSRKSCISPPHTATLPDRLFFYPSTPEYPLSILMTVILLMTAQPSIAVMSKLHSPGDTESAAPLNS